VVYVLNVKKELDVKKEKGVVRGSVQS